ncbi:50S ribosomal protein L11 methyltransferase [Reichenbachiella versicolor]|uniref:50S ribosomal protein L11 methyltransferase n=1 Tax=Reichenbachiella versicolor TaxID=1821036 RepID=UPI000D6DC7ED|nr:50S ribosomal protein L11 methyltransferase [Reichenbachiella versicolor]
MSFIKVSISTTPEFGEIFTAELAEIGFETFEETATGIDAYIPQENFKETDLKTVIEQYASMTKVSYELEEVAKQNWNEEWEKNYDPIEVEGKCRVRATFHDPDPSFQYEIIVIPKMSFGTGHHATTYNMIKLEMEHDFVGKSVLDLGTGTGILAIMAMKLGAKSIECTDIDEWCIENSAENFGLNDLVDIPCHLGTVNNVSFRQTEYHVVLANINKNVLLSEMQYYANLLSSGGALFLSGFYEQDIDQIKNEALKHNLSVVDSVIKNDWAALKLIKS